ncbi:MAG: BMP family ABC transporter substrate-binding protein [Firmicutes bacterium]|nr:BMP family ABC transporter substrate-binding protein [Bacillota bacterium]
MKKKKKIFSVLTLIIVVIGVMVIGLLMNSQRLHKSEQGLTDSKLKIGYIIDGNKDDNNLYISAYNGILNVKDETESYFSMRENISADKLESTAQTYADDGFNIVILCGVDYDPIAEKLAGEFPNTKFIVLNSRLENGTNLGSLYMDYRSSGFIKGMIAGYVTKNNVIAGIGYSEDNATMYELYGFETGVHYVDADIQVYNEYVTKRGGDTTAGSLLEEFTTYGADTVIAVAGNKDIEVLDKAESKNLYAFGSSISYIESYPDIVMAVTSFDISGGIGDIIKMVYENGFNGESIALDFDIEYNDGLKARIPTSGLTKVDSVLNNLKSGKLDIDKLAPLE